MSAIVKKSPLYKNLYRSLTTLFILSCFFLSPLHANAIDSKDAKDAKGSTKVFTLEECIDVALKTDPNIKISKDLKGIYKSRVGQAKSDYFPNLTGGTGYYYQNTNNKNNNNTGFGGTNNNESNYYQLNLGVNQLIWNFGKSAAKINMQKFNLESAGYDLDYAVLDTTYRVKMAYFNVLAALANLDVYERSVRINQLHCERTKAMFEEGLKSKIDLVNAEVYLTDAEIQLLDAQNKYQLAIINLSNAMYSTDLGIYSIKNTESFNFQRVQAVQNEVLVSNKKKLKELAKPEQNEEGMTILTSEIEKQDILQDYKFQPLMLPLDEAMKRAYENRPDLKSLEMVKRASEESLKTVKRSYYPDLGASAGYSFRKNSDYQNSGFNVSAGLDLPMINIMDIKNRVDEATLYLDIAGENIDLLRKNIYFEVQNNYINMLRLQNKIPLMHQKVKQTLENFELADGRYSVGLGNFIELQDAQTNYNSAQLAFVQTVFDYNVAREQFQKSMGVN